MKYIKTAKKEINPFIVNQPIEAIAMPKDDAVGQSFDVKDYSKTHYLLDKQEKVIVFRYGKRAINNLMFGSLSTKGRDLFLYIMYNIDKDRDFILLSAQKVRQEMGISPRTITASIAELRDHNIIAFKSKSIYWVNPMYIFNGNRINYYKGLGADNIVIKSILKHQST